MSRIANNPVSLPAGVELKVSNSEITAKGSKGSLTIAAYPGVEVKVEDGNATFAAKNSAKQSKAMAGTMRSLVNNMVTGVTQGFEKKLVLNGVGYRAKASGKSLNLTLGFSHPVDYNLPEGVSAETPSQTEVVLKSIDKQLWLWLKLYNRTR